MIKQSLKKLARVTAGWPVIGRFVRVGIAVIRLPALQTTLTRFEIEQLPTILQSISEVNGRQLQSENDTRRVLETLTRFEHDQLPTLLQTVADVNERTLRAASEEENLLRSLPVSLRRITRDLAELHAQFHETRAHVDNVTRDLSNDRAWLESLTQSLGDTRTQVGSMADSLGYLLGRVEFVRRELMFEMRYGGASRDGQALRAAQEILQPEKLVAAKSALCRLNLGCGHVPLDGYLNVDRRRLPGVDVVAEVDDLPFDPGEVDEIFSAHLLEHFPQEQLRRELLPYCFGLLKQGGKFRAVVPDAAAMIREYADGRYPYGHMREVMYGSQDYDGDFHFNMFTPDSLSELLREAGFQDIRVDAEGRKNGDCYEFEISARK